MINTIVHYIRPIIAAAAAILTVLTLAGCGESGTADDPAKVSGGESGNSVNPTWTVYELPDGRRVGCIVQYRGLSCDWPHADGADKGGMK